MIGSSKKPGSAQPQPRRWIRRIAWALGIIAILPVVTALCLYIGALFRETHTAADLAPSYGRLVETRQGRIFVQDEGPRDGQPVILIHGTAAWSELWRETIDALAAARFRVIAIDLPPFGFTARPANGDYTRAEQAKRIAALIDALELRSAILVGHSFGAGPTVETVMRYPEKVSGLVLIAGALQISDPSGPRPPPAIVAALLDIPALRNPLVASLVTNPLMTRTLMGSMVYRKSAVTDRRVAVLQHPMTLRASTSDLGNWLRYFTSIDSAAWSMDRGRYRAITAKTALIWGERDALTPMDQANDLHGLFAGSSLTVLPEIGHIPQIEDPALLAPVLLKALQAMR